MSFVHMRDLVVEARKNKYAVGAFTVWDLASIHAVISVAHELNKPTILMIGPNEIGYAGLADLSRLAIDQAHMAKTPVAVHLDHGQSFDQIMQCINHGFSSVMLDVSHLPFDQNVEATREVVRVAHSCGVTVEGELGRIGGHEAGTDVIDHDDYLTDPNEAATYVEQTGVDCLAVGIGTVHGLYKCKPNIHLDRLKRISQKVRVPLVLHGGSDTPHEIIKKAISLGIAKINICTDFLIAFADTFVSQRSQTDFKLSIPGVFSKPKSAASEIVRSKIKLFSGL